MVNLYLPTCRHLYLARKMGSVDFPVRDDRDASLIFQCSDTTWQAYNRWPSQFAL